MTRIKNYDFFGFAFLLVFVFVLFLVFWENSNLYRWGVLRGSRRFEVFIELEVAVREFVNIRMESRRLVGSCSYVWL